MKMGSDVGLYYDDGMADRFWCTNFDVDQPLNYIYAFTTNSSCPTTLRISIDPYICLPDLIYTQFAPRERRAWVRICAKAQG